MSKGITIQHPHKSRLAELRRMGQDHFQFQRQLQYDAQQRAALRKAKMIMAGMYAILILGVGGLVVTMIQQ